MWDVWQRGERPRAFKRPGGERVTPSAHKVPEGQASDFAVARPRDRLASAGTVGAGRGALSADPARQPRHFDARHISVSSAQQGRNAEALELVATRAQVEARLCRGALQPRHILAALGRYEEALASFDEALRHRARLVEAHNNRGNALQAAAATRRRLRASTGRWRCARLHRGAQQSRQCAAGLKRYDEAVAMLRPRAGARPDYPDALYNRGNALQGAQALSTRRCAGYEKAISLRPTIPMPVGFARGGAGDLRLGAHRRLATACDVGLAGRARRSSIRSR